MVALSSRVARLERRQEEGRPPVSSSLFAEWFVRLHQQINQVEDWDNPPLGCMGMANGRCYKWVITIPMWSYWCKKINLVNGREILQIEYDSPAAAAENFQLGAALANQAYDNVVSGRN
jgi:hypothetical protein